MRWKAPKTLTRAIALAAVLALALPWAVLADNLQDELQAGSTYNPSIHEGSEFVTEIRYVIQRTGNNNINQFPAEVKFELQGAPDWVSLSSTSLSFSGYGAGNGQSLTIRGTAPSGSAGTHSFTIVPSTDVANLNVNPAKQDMTVTVTPAAPSDTTPPTTSAGVSGQEGKNGWYTSDVTVTLSATDTTSGVAATYYQIADGAVATYDGPFSLSDDGIYTVSYWSVDNAGNIEEAKAVEIKIDQTPPVITPESRKPEANSAGWNNEPVTVTWTCTDATSGAVNSSVSTTVDTEGYNQSATGMCEDEAGNTAEDTVTDINIDMTPPTAPIASFSPSAAYNDGTNDWYQGQVTVSFGGSTDPDLEDGSEGSGVVSYSDPQTFSATGAHTYSGTATDAAGNESDAVTGTVYVDADAPTIEDLGPTAGPDGNNGWYTSPVTNRFQASDEGAGFDGKPNPYEFTQSSSMTEGEAVTIHSGPVSDAVGNTNEGISSQPFKIDLTAPYNVSGGPDRGPDHNGWYNKPVTIVFTGQDDVSGIDSCTEVTYGGPDGAGVTVDGSCTDVAGHTSDPVASSAFNYDATAPTDITFIGDLIDGMEYYWGDTPPEPTCTATDNVSGLASCEVTGYSTAVGEHTLTATATDNAGNTATATITYTVKAWTLSGFFKPVDMDKYNTVKGGSTVPLKFQVFKGTTEVTSPAAIASITATAYQCEAGVPTSEVEEWATTTGATDLRYTGGQFMYNWKTPKAPGACYKVTVTTQDGSKLTALFRLK